MDMEIVKQKIENDEIYARIESVSRSGLSRQIRFFVIENNYPYDVTKEIKEMLNMIYKSKIKVDYKPLKVAGCGFDPINHVLCNLGYDAARYHKMP